MWWRKHQRTHVQVRERRFAPFVRLEVQADMPLDLTEFLVHELSLTLEQDVYRVPEVLDLEQLARTTRCAFSLDISSHQTNRFAHCMLRVVHSAAANGCQHGGLVAEPEWLLVSGIVLTCDAERLDAVLHSRIIARAGALTRTPSWCTRRGTRRCTRA